MKVLASPENKRIYTEDDIRQFIGLYHLGALNLTDDPVLTAIVLEEIHKDNEEPQDIKPLSLKQKILKYTCLFIFAGFFLSLIIVLLYIASKSRLVNFFLSLEEVPWKIHCCKKSKVSGKGQDLVFDYFVVKL